MIVLNHSWIFYVRTTDGRSLLTTETEIETEIEIEIEIETETKIEVSVGMVLWKREERRLYEVAIPTVGGYCLLSAESNWSAQLSNSDESKKGGSIEKIVDENIKTSGGGSEDYLKSSIKKSGASH